MVLYHPNGRVVIAHENYLEREALREASESTYTEQIAVCNKRGEAASLEPVRIIIDTQKFKTLHCATADSKGNHWEYLNRFHQQGEEEIPVDLDRRTLMLCSTFAEEHFRFNPGEHELHLPLSFPNNHRGFQYDTLMAYIRSHEIKEYVIPWLKRVQAHEEKCKKMKDKTGCASTEVVADKDSKTSSKRHTAPNIPEALTITLPESLSEKIHLYNAMLQLGLPKFVQQPLVDELILEMYKRKFRDCHLDILEMTVGRFHSRSIPILDPVLNHFFGTYAFRTPEDRKQVYSDEHLSKELSPQEQETYDEENPPTDFSQTNRKYVDYVEDKANGGSYPNDTAIMPPERPVIGHSIRHWTGLLRNGSTAAAYTGFPLNTGRSRKYFRRSSTTAFDEDDFVDIETNRLASHDYYRQNRPGTKNSSALRDVSGQFFQREG